MARGFAEIRPVVTPPPGPSVTGDWVELSPVGSTFVCGRPATAGEAEFSPSARNAGTSSQRPASIRRRTSRSSSWVRPWWSQCPHSSVADRRSRFHSSSRPRVPPFYSPARPLQQHRSSIWKAEMRTRGRLQGGTGGYKREPLFSENLRQELAGVRPTSADRARRPNRRRQAPMPPPPQEGPARSRPGLAAQTGGLAPARSRAP
jgi:hypothetical protein